MDYLDGIFGDHMLALKAWQGQEWAPYSPDSKLCDFFVGISQISCLQAFAFKLE